LDGDDPANQGIKLEYGVNSYPRIVFTDSTGMSIEQVHGGMSREAFEAKVKSMLGQN
jgi:thioredoxin-related protein